MMRAIIAFLLLVASFYGPLHAMEAGEALHDRLLETRAIALGSQLRCMVCQSESINDSPAPLAKDLRLLVRTKLVEGMTDAEVLSFLQDRYGDYVLLKPPVKAATLPLWIAPWLVLAGGFASFFFYLRSRKKRRAP